MGAIAIGVVVLYAAGALFWVIGRAFMRWDNRRTREAGLLPAFDNIRPRADVEAVFLGLCLSVAGLAALGALTVVSRVVGEAVLGLFR